MEDEAAAPTVTAVESETESTSAQQESQGSSDEDVAAELRKSAATVLANESEQHEQEQEQEEEETCAGSTLLDVANSMKLEEASTTQLKASQPETSEAEQDEAAVRVLSGKTVSKSKSKSKQKRKKSALPCNPAAWDKLFVGSSGTPTSSRRRGKEAAHAKAHTSAAQRAKVVQMRASRERLSRSSSYSSSPRAKGKTRKGDESGTNGRDRDRDKGKGKSKSAEHDECTFEPRINKSSRNMVRGSGSFLKRFETAHDSKQLALETRRAKAEYEARVDKKVCPSCGATQSYDECRHHKNKCRDCKKAFKHKLLWQEVGSGFIDRMEAKLEEKERKVAELEEKTAPSFLPSSKVVYDADLGATYVSRPAPVAWEDVRQSFMGRMERDAKKRQVKRVLAEQDALRTAGCTFTPELAAHNYGRRPESQHGDVDLGLLDDSFQERMERDCARRERERAQNELRTALGATLGDFGDTIGAFKKRSAWDDADAAFSGGLRRNPSGQWV